MTNTIDTTIVILYLAVCLYIGLYNTKNIINLRHFAIGSKNTNSFILAAIIFATVTGAGSTIGVVEKIYLSGIAILLQQLLSPLGWLVSANVFGKNIERFKGCFTVAQIMHRLYGNVGRVTTVTMSVAVNIGFIAIQAIAIGHILHYFFGIASLQGVIVSYTVLTVYSMLGGIRSVVLTELFQFVIFFGIIPATAVWAFQTNLDIILINTHILPETHFNFEINFNSILLIIGIALYGLMPDCSSEIIQRHLMADNAKTLVKSLKLVALLSFIFTAILCFVAYQLKILAPTTEAADALLYFTNALPVGIKGLMIAGLLAIAMSTAEAQINSSAVIMVNDCIKPLFPKINDQAQLIAARLATVMIAIIALIPLLILFLEKELISFILFVSSIWHSLILIPIMAGFWGFKTSSKTLVAAILSTFAFIALGIIIVGSLDASTLIFGLIGSAIGFFGYHYFQTRLGKVEGTVITLQKIIAPIRRQYEAIPAMLKWFGQSIYEHMKLDHIRYDAFCGFTLCCYLGHFLMLSSAPANAILGVLMPIGFILCGPILMRDICFKSKATKAYLRPYFYLAIIFCQPVIGSFMIFASSGNIIWTINGILFMFMTFFFLNSINSVLIMSFGTMLGYIVLHFTHPYFQTVTATSNFTGYFIAPYVYAFFIIAGFFFLRPREQLHEEKLATIRLIGGAIAHEAQAPTGLMVTSANALAEELGMVMKRSKTRRGNYEIAPEEAEFLISMSKNIKSTGEKGEKIISNILRMLRTSLEEAEMQVCKISEAVTEALSEYAMFNKKAKQVEIAISEDFSVSCVPDSLQYVFFNLVKNSYKHGGETVKVRIYNEEKNKLCFMDDGKGIPPEIMPHIFERFYTKSKDGTGLGLAYCKMAIEAFGGTISCESRVGKYTKFTIEFPRVIIASSSY